MLSPLMTKSGQAGKSKIFLKAISKSLHFSQTNPDALPSHYIPASLNSQKAFDMWKHQLILV